VIPSFEPRLDPIGGVPQKPDACSNQTQEVRNVLFICLSHREEIELHLKADLCRLDGKRPAGTVLT
jgi:hypothetical protein